MRDVVVDTEVIRDALWLACRAPSLHNSQPWRWRIEGSAVQLFLDAERAPRHTDTTGRELVISCGAVLDHFRVAMAAAAWHTNVDRFPNPNNHHHLASLDFSPLDFVTDGHRQRADAILRRRTDRLPFAAPEDWEAFAESLAPAGGIDDVRVDVIGEEGRAALAEASQLTESLRLYDSPYHAELVGWTVDLPLDEGIPASALPSAAESDRVDIGRTFPVVKHPERRREIADDHANVVVLSTYDDTVHNYLRCGEALSAVLLDATMAGLATCTLTHITEVPASRQVVAEMIGAGDAVTPQVLIRVGVAPGSEDMSPPTPRRPIDEVLEIR
ncbi:NAD(P)H nitroreductase [Mycobacterium sp. Y57]|uniref:Acg family FMN-binding oxidoreductase n=1 Tax=Mycolicibacterium xanthum TaxID=2796469 RepID=UPI001C845274|nr:NAD(P)H nitroreductase [Mycolicibacterium xanthum]MBX7433664.1 NAD(P)H nitroreductase [Mycolicibacterium xanthum]